MPIDRLQLIGAGGHGRVVLDALLCKGWDPACIIVQDDRVDLGGTRMLGCTVNVPVKPAHATGGWVHAAVGHAQLRESLLNQSGLAANRWLTICHPRAVVATSAAILDGSFVAALAVIGPCAAVGRGSIVNHGAVVDHDCEVGDFCHVGPNVALGGGVRVGRAVLIGAGATVLAGVRIGDGAVIGAGAVVLKDVPAGQTFAGIPARNILEGK